MPPKVRAYELAELLAKLDGKAALWARTARDAEERAADFERAAQAIRAGATSAQVGRTTYVVDAGTDSE